MNDHTPEPPTLMFDHLRVVRQTAAPWGATYLAFEAAQTVAPCLPGGASWWHVELLRPDWAVQAQQLNLWRTWSVSPFVRGVHRNLAECAQVLASDPGESCIGLAWRISPVGDGEAATPPATLTERANYWAGSIAGAVLRDVVFQLCDSVRALHALGRPGDPHGFPPLHQLMLPTMCYFVAANQPRLVGHGLGVLLQNISPGVYRTVVMDEACRTLAPELRQGHAPSGVAADMHGLGSMVFQVATSRVFDPGGDTSIGPVHRAIEQLLRECLRPNPAQRPASVEQALRRLDQAADLTGDPLPVNIPFARAEARSTAPGRTASLSPAGADDESFDSMQMTFRPALDDAPAILPSPDSLMPRMLLIPGGWFIQGARRGDADERPERDVVLDAFYLAETAVTNALLVEFLNACGNEGECHFRESKYSPLKRSWLKREWTVSAAFARHPANNLTHLGAEAIAQYLSERHSMCFRLPTEAEWEGAARLGLPHEAPYPWGADFPTPVHARFGRSFAEAKHHAMAPVDANPAGAARCGALNMAGNVWEWCSDWYKRDAYIGGPAVNPKGPDAGTQRVARGGCWTSNTHELRITNRRAEPPVPEAALGMGLRLAMSAPPEALHAPLSMTLCEVRLRYSLHQASRVPPRDA